jgi:hypothetical protein
VALASTPQREILVGRLASLRDFLLLFFFVDLGARLELAQLAAQLWTALGLSLLVLVGKPLVVLWTMGWLGYRSRTAFLAGLAVSQISEFSLILGALGVSLGHLAAGTLGLITLVGLTTIAASTYLILYSHPLYDRLAPALEVFERRVAFAEEERLPPAEAAEILLVGLGRHGGHLAAVLRQRARRVLGVDFDPETVATWRESGLPARLGDATDPEFAATLPLGEAAWVVCTLPDLHSNLALLHTLREHGFGGRIALGARTAEDARHLSESGADAVLYPFEDAAQEAADLLCDPQPRDPFLASHLEG